MIGKFFQGDDWFDFVFTLYICVGGWFLHFFPFALMGRVTYLHHYFPALYFAILAIAFLIEHLVGSRKQLRRMVNLSLGVIVLGVFLHFAPLSYGFKGPASQYKNRQWLSTWTMA